VEEVESTYVPLMIPLGTPCPADVKVGKCARTDLCGHRKAARVLDEEAVRREMVEPFKAMVDEATAKVAGVR
jgi:hypothetical protein